MIKKETLQAVSQQIKTEFKGSLGRCQRITERAQVLLAEHGIDTTIVKGEAAFRVGNSPLANVSYVKAVVAADSLYNADLDTVFHYWLTDENNMILDFTTFTFRDIVAHMDKLERVKKPTKVSWSPDYLYVRRNECVSLNKVNHGNRDKMFFYKPLVESNSDVFAPNSFTNESVIVFAKHTNADYPYTVLHKKYGRLVVSTVDESSPLMPNWIMTDPEEAIDQFLSDFTEKDYDFSKVIYNPSNKELTDLFMAKVGKLGWVEAPAELFS